MSIEYFDFPQGSDEWYKARLGIITASMVGTLVTPTGKVAKNDKVRSYAYALAAERINAFSEEHYCSYDMQRGQFQEVLAREIYNDNIAAVTEVGFVTNVIDGVTVGASPDGLVGDEGGIEIKSRLGKFQVKTIIDDAVPAEYMAQIQASLLVTGREWWDFVQYSNGMHLYTKRVLPDIAYHDLLRGALVTFEETVVSLVEQYTQLTKELPLADRVDFNGDDDIIAGVEND